MAGNSDPSGLDGVPDAAKDRESSIFDYIIVGSGAGGAPLAARLAEAGKRVLVLEAGVDPGASPDLSPEDLTAEENRRAIFHCPGFQAASSEPEEFASTPDENKVSWHFQARHLPDPVQQQDPKSEAYRGQQVFYPRCSAIGGCTSHNTMVTIYGTEQDWSRIADLTGDPSWNPERMRYYFQRLERARYTRIRLTWFGRIYSRIISWLKPERVAAADHGMAGWLDIATADPKLTLKDGQMLSTLAAAVEIEGMSTLGKAWRILRRFFWGRLYQDLDPNDKRTIRESPEGLALIPIACGLGRRSGPREFLLETRQKAMDGELGLGKLKIATGVLVKRVIFEAPEESDGKTTQPSPPRAIGVEYAVGNRLYMASRPPGNASVDVDQCFVRRGGEVILCGGAFNTPQLLMLSGIGDASHLKSVGISGPRDQKGNAVTDSPIHLPGVGQNLRDRYETSVITRMKKPFSILNKVNYDPDVDEDKDPERKRWNTPISGSDRERKGLYSTSGPSIAIIKKSTQTESEDDPADLFLFGVPAAFRGYFPAWSRQLFRENPDYAGSPVNDPNLDCRKLWSWVILKAYSRNRGTVRLVSSDPREAPEIDFNYFDASNPGSQSDLEALAEGIAYARRLNDSIEDRVDAEIEPAIDDPYKLREWIKTRSWGHHACGTCRLGKDSWRASTGDLEDTGAVVDSKFQVHGVKSLRIVDASIFNEIPGYFIVTPTYMISEKASDTLLEKDARYPARLEGDEARTVRKRRQAALRDRETPNDRNPESLPADTVGLALSGGGIRSATFSLGILQGLAKRKRIRDIDFLSTISGGGYIGSFLGRLFTRKNIENAIDPVEAVEDTLTDPGSAPVQWLRSTANYIKGAGGKDGRQIYALVIRNLFTIYFVLSLAGIAAFGVLRLAANVIGSWVPVTENPPFLAGIDPDWLSVVSPWWWLPLVILILGVLPAAFSYWLAPKPGTTGLLSFYPAVGWAILLGGFALIASLPGGILPAILVGAIMLMTLILTEWSRPKWPKTHKQRPDVGAVMRNDLTLKVSGLLTAFFLATGWFVLDSLSRACADGVLLTILSSIWVATMPFLPVVRSFVSKLTGGSDQKGGGGSFLVPLIAIPLALILLIFINASVHALFALDLRWGIAATGLALLLSLAFGRGIDFVNASSLQTGYGARLARTFLGASNPERIYGEPDARTRDVRLTHRKDDIAFHNYHPENNGGPLHLIGVCINETVDAASSRDIPDRKGLLMTVGPCGISAGRYHGVWTEPDRKLPFKVWINHLLDGAHPEKNAATAIHGIRVPGRKFHALRAKDNRSIDVEPLSLKTWIAISGAAFTTGLGRQTSKAMALLLGLANVRLGYWWDTRLDAGDRPGRFRESIFRRLKRLPSWMARMQSLLLNEFRARFPGPGYRHWYLSDGGHFEYTGVYELLRRRPPLIISSCASDSGLNKIEELVRQARIDFEAEITFIEPEPDSPNPAGKSKKKKGKKKTKATGEPWDRFHQEVHPLIKEWFDPAHFGSLAQTGRGKGKRAALASVKYRGSDDVETWIVVIRPTVLDSDPTDIVNYAKNHETFPQESTIDQFFDEAQWESYRKLGELSATDVLKAP